MEAALDSPEGTYRYCPSMWGLYSESQNPLGFTSDKGCKERKTSTGTMPAKVRAFSAFSLNSHLPQPS